MILSLRESVCQSPISASARASRRERAAPRPNRPSQRSCFSCDCVCYKPFRPRPGRVAGRGPRPGRMDPLEDDSACLCYKFMSASARACRQDRPGPRPNRSSHRSFSSRGHPFVRGPIRPGLWPARRDSQHQSTYSQHTVNTQSTHSQHRS